MARRYIWILTVVLLGLAACGGEEMAPTAEATAVPTRSPATTTAVPPTVAAPATATPIPTAASVTISLETMTLSDGTVLEYALALPPGYDAQRTYPVLLALPPGSQTRRLVEDGLTRYWAAGAREHGFIVVSPAAPGDTLFFEAEAARYIPEFLQQIAERFPPEGGNFHLAGVSNGGISAFHVAMNDQELFRSLLVLPGVPRDVADFNRLDNLVDIPIAMYVGELDSDWRERSQEAALELQSKGADVTLEIVTGEGHILESVTPDELFRFLTAQRP